MILISFLTALLMLFIYKKTSNQAAIKQVKSQIKASLLELRLYQNDFRTLLSSQKELLTANWRYLLLNFKPLLIMIIPIFLILAQLNLWFNYKSIQPGETFLLKVKFIDEVDMEGINLDLKAPKGLTVETPVLRIIDEKEADWRLRLEDQVSEALIITVNGQRFQKEIPSIKNSLGRVSTIRVRKNLWQELLYPGEKPLPAESVIKRIEVVYPEQRLNCLGIGFHWLVAYFLLSIIFGLALKRPFKVEI
ncbi:MAG: hypothetical protein PHQ25_03650 [Acidobacteriota bacterium]|nr:hypothetical protein [Acidobacteriota bacterium]MDW3228788.1 hypothetical protein [Acidobacteriota bacterium]